MGAFNGIMKRDAKGLIVSRPPEYFIQRDLSILKEEARHIFFLENSDIREHHNQNGDLNVIAIIGEGYFPNNGNELYEGLLCEIGFWSARPYRLVKRAQKKRTPGKIMKFWPRHTYFSTTPEQYQLVAPRIFSLLQRLTDEQCSRRHCNQENPFIAPGVKYYWSRDKGKLFIDASYRPHFYGLRFTVSRKDTLLLQDIFWASLSSEETKNRLKEFSDLVKECVEHCRRKNRKRPLAKFPSMQQILKMAGSQKISLYLTAEILENYFDRKNPKWDELCDLFGWNQQTPEQLVLARGCLSDPYARVGKTQIRICKEYPDYVVFEVLPTPPVTNDTEEPF